MAFCFFLIVVCGQSRQIFQEKKYPTIIVESEPPVLPQKGKGFLLCTLLTIILMFISFCLGIIGWGIGIWVEDSMPLKEKSMDEVQRLSQSGGHEA